MICSKCGAQVSDSAKFCPECGSSIEDNSLSSLSDKKVGHYDSVGDKPIDSNNLLYTATRSAWAAKRKIIACLFFGILFLFLALVFFIDNQGTKDEIAAMNVCGVLSLIPVIICIVSLVFSILIAISYKIEIYPNKIIITSGFISKKVKQSIMTPIIGVEISQSVNGRLWNYGDVRIDKIGSGWDIDSDYINNPEDFKKFLETLIDEAAVNKNIQMHVIG